MLEQSFSRLYDKIRLQSYRKVFELIKEREGSLSAMEAFSLEIIRMLDKPTISEFADFLNISQSNATYKVNCLIRKGYIERENSSRDHREYHLVFSEKYHNYLGFINGYEKVVLERIRNRFSEEDVNKFDSMLQTIADELMPECTITSGCDNEK